MIWIKARASRGVTGKRMGFHRFRVNDLHQRALRAKRLIHESFVKEAVMLRRFIPAGLLAVAMLMPAQSAQAQDPLGGAILGGGLGAIIGGAAGGGRGAAIGAIIGATTGAAIAAQGERRGDYWYYDRGCYMQQPDGSYVVVAPRYCVAEEGPPVGDEWCARRYRSYDPESGTFMGRDGRRHPCPG